MASRRLLSLLLVLVAGTWYFLVLTQRPANRLLPFLAGTLYVAWACARKGKPVFASFAVGSVVLYLSIVSFVFLSEARTFLYVILQEPPRLRYLEPLLWFPALTGAIRIAKPDSPWARNRYFDTQVGEQKMAMACQRFPSNVPVGVADLDP